MNRCEAWDCCLWREQTMFLSNGLNQEKGDLWEEGHQRECQNLYAQKNPGFSHDKTYSDLADGGCNPELRAHGRGHFADDGTKDGKCTVQSRLNAESIDARQEKRKHYDHHGKTGKEKAHD